MYLKDNALQYAIQVQTIFMVSTIINIETNDLVRHTFKHLFKFDKNYNRVEGSQARVSNERNKASTC